MGFSDFYSKLSSQEKKIFYVAALIVFVMIMDRIFLGPVFSKMALIDEQINERKSMIERDLRLLSYKERILLDNQSLNPYYEEKSKTVEQIITEFLKKLEIMASTTNINLIKVTPSDSVEKKGYSEYYANLECEGLLEDVIRFMHTIDTSQDLLKITKVNMSLKRLTGDEVLVGMVVAKMIIDAPGGFSALEEEKTLPVASKSYQRESTKGESSEDKMLGRDQGTSSRSSGSTSQDDSGSAEDPGSSGGSQSNEESADFGTGGGAGGSSGPEQSSQKELKAGQQGGLSSSLAPRFPMTGIDKMDFLPQETEAGDEIKPSIFERILKKVEEKPR